jgi:hypothetical protein
MLYQLSYAPTATAILLPGRAPVILTCSEDATTVGA